MRAGRMHAQVSHPNAPIPLSLPLSLSSACPRGFSPYFVHSLLSLPPIRSLPLFRYV